MKSFIQFLSEQRSNSEKNPKTNIIDQLMKYKKDANNLYISFTLLDKIGINPQSHFTGTPNGIYTYHLSYVMSEIAKHDGNDLEAVPVPFAGEAKYMWIVKPTKNILILQQYSEQMLQTDLQKIELYYNKQQRDIPFKQYLSKITQRISNKSFGSIMWNVVANMIRNHNEQNSILRNVLGYSIIRDDGDGIIHPDERQQCVFLSKDSFAVVEKINNRTFDAVWRKETALRDLPNKNDSDDQWEVGL